MKPIILGIDPGTTVGYAILNLEGQVIKVQSKKELSLSQLIKKVYEYGKPLAVGTDKKNIPSFIKYFATKTGCKIFNPDEDLPIKEKKVSYKTKNDHESDALASAIFAYNRLKVKIQRIKKFSEYELPELVIKKGLPLIQSVKEREIQVIKKRSKQQTNTNKLIEKNNKLQEQNEILMNEIILLKKTIQTISDKNISKPKNNKNTNITKLIESMEGEMRQLKIQIKMQKRFLSERSNLIIKKFKDLNNIDVNDKIIIIENPQNYSQKEINKLKSLMYIITDKKCDLPFLMIDKNGLIIEETEDFALVNKNEFEKRVNKKELFSKILTNYQKSRK